MNAPRVPVLLLALGLVLAPPLGAQVGGEGNRGKNREALELRVRERLGRLVKEQLNLSDEQVTRLQQTNRKFERERIALVEQERDIRISVRSEVLAGDSANQTRVAALIDQMLKVQRQRTEIVEREQRELAAFLTPVQRVKYLVLQEQVRRRVEEFRQRGPQRGGVGGGAGPGRPGGGGRMPRKPRVP